MNPLILSLAPLGGLATALPAMTAAATRTVAPAGLRPKTDASPGRPVEAGRETPIHERHGGYLLL